MNHRGSIYFLTLASSIILVLTVTGLSFTIIQFRRESRSNQQIDQAEIYTQLGIRHALYFTHQIPNWRNLLTSGPWMQNISNGNATYTVTGIDMVDGQLNNGINAVQLACTTTVNGVHRTLTVETEQPPLDSLRFAITAGQSIIMTNKSVINGDVASNANIDNSDASTFINGNVEVVTSINLTENISGSITTGIEPKTFPYSPSLLEYYASQATPIMYQDTLQEILLSPSTNPFGTTNPYGLYMINCGGNQITIRDCRIVGTLILINPSSDSLIKDGINMQPARADYPALIIEGDMNILPSKDLNEADSNIDFSLPGESGIGSITNTYPSLIQGAIYCNGNLILDQTCDIFGTVIATGAVEMRSESQISVNEALWNNPPKQFNETYLEPISNTWQ
jgi:hypothetical protein